MLNLLGNLDIVAMTIVFKGSLLWVFSGLQGYEKKLWRTHVVVSQRIQMARQKRIVCARTDYIRWTREWN